MAMKGPSGYICSRCGQQEKMAAQGVEQVDRHPVFHHLDPYHHHHHHHPLDPMVLTCLMMKVGVKALSGVTTW